MSTNGLSNPSPKPAPPPTLGGAWLRPLYTSTKHYYPRADLGYVTICGKLTAPARTVRADGTAFGKLVPTCPECTRHVNRLSMPGRWLALLQGDTAHHMRGNGPTACGLLWDPLYTTKNVAGLPLCPTCEAAQ